MIYNSAIYGLHLQKSIMSYLDYRTLRPISPVPKILKSVSEAEKKKSLAASASKKRVVREVADDDEIIMYSDVTPKPNGLEAYTIQEMLDEIGRRTTRARICKQSM